MKKAKKLIINILKLLVGGIFVSAIWEFLVKDSLVRFGRWILEFSSKFSLLLTDFVYSSPSESDLIFVILPSFIILLIVLFYFSGQIAETLLLRFVDRKYELKHEKTLEKIREFEKKIELINESEDSSAIEPFKVDDVVSRDVGKKSNSFLESIIVKILNSDTKFNKGLEVLNLVCISLLLVIATSVLSTSSVKYTIKRGTEKNLRILKPFITENQYDLLYSRYLQIKSKEDYENVFSELKKIGISNKITIADPSKSN